ncbi:MAG: uroporphyrinogen-III C-methyltransferase [Pseudomonadota bacterium]
MTEKSAGSDSDAASLDESSDVVTTDPAPEDAAFEEAPPAKPKGSGFTTLVALLALVVALGSLAAVGYFQFMAGPEEPADAGSEQIAPLRASLSGAEATIARLEQQVRALERGAGEDIDADAIERRLSQRLSQDLSGRLDLLQSVPARIASIEQSLSALRGISTGARDAWLLAEAEYYLQIANAQARLAGNPLLATLALKLADERLVEVGDPGLTDVRRALAQEIRALEGIEDPDVEGAALTLASLAEAVSALPIDQEVAVPEANGAAPAEGLSGTDRALASLKQSLSGIVRVRRTDEAATPLLPPEATYFLRANLALKLQSARLALLTGEQTLFRQSLDEASAWLREYYDSEATPVRSALETIGDLRDGSFATEIPDISESLRLVREYVAFIDAARRDTAPPPANAPVESPPEARNATPNEPADPPTDEASDAPSSEPAETPLAETDAETAQ